MRRIRISSTAKAGPQHFLGVTVQPMVTVEGYELGFCRRHLNPQFRCILVLRNRVASSSRCIATISARARRSTLARRLIEQTQGL